MYSANNPNEEILRLRAENEKLRAALAAERRRAYEEAAEDIERLRAAIVEKETVMKIRAAAAAAATMDGGNE